MPKSFLGYSSPFFFLNFKVHINEDFTSKKRLNSV
jgi:hypothetical protein